MAMILIIDEILYLLDHYLLFCILSSHPISLYHYNYTLIQSNPLFLFICPLICFMVWFCCAGSISLLPLTGNRPLLLLITSLTYPLTLTPTNPLPLPPFLLIGNTVTRLSSLLLPHLLIPLSLLSTPYPSPPHSSSPPFSLTPPPLTVDRIRTFAT